MKNSNALVKPPILIVILALVTTFGFQNCGAPFAVENLMEMTSKSERDTTFDYPYEAKPDFYTHMALYRNVSEIEDLSEFTVLGAATLIEDSAALIQYRVTVRNSEGSLICPTQSGTLSGGSTEIEFDCTAPEDNQHAVVTLAVSSGSKSAILEQSY